MRILHLVSYSLYSGPVPSTLGLALAQRRAGHEVFVAIDRKRGAQRGYEEPAAPRLEGCDLSPPQPLTLSTKSSALEAWRDLRGLRQLAVSLDLVHTHMSHDHALAILALPRRSRTALVRTFHASRSLVPRLGQRFVNRHADAWITRSAAHRARLLESFAVASERVFVVPGSVDTELFAPRPPPERRALRARFGVPEDAFVLVQAAFLGGRGQEELVTALAQMSEPRPYVLLAGRGEREESLRSLCAALGVQAHVRFAGYLPDRDLVAAYAASDAAFVAQAGNDASARAALEAMAMRLPVLAVVAEAALAELVTEERGFPISSREPPALASGLLTLLAAPAERERRAAAAWEYVRRERGFAVEAEAALRVYEAACAWARAGAH